MRDRRGLPLVVGGTALIACTYGLARYGYGLFLPSFRADFALSSTLSGLLATGAFGSYCAAALLSGHLVSTGRSRLAAGARRRGGGRRVRRCRGRAHGRRARRGPPRRRHRRRSRLPGARRSRGPRGHGARPPARPDRRQRRHRCGRAARRPAGPRAGRALARRLALLRSAHGRGDGGHRAGRRVARSGTRRADRPRAGGPSLRPAVLAALLAGTGSAAVWTFGRDLVVSAGELTPLTSTLFWVLLGAAGVTGAVAGDAVQRWDVPRAWAAFALLLAAATAGLALAPGVVAVAFGCGAAFGGSYVALSGVVIAWGTQLRPDSPGTANAVLFLTLAAGQALGALLVGGLADLVGLRSPSSSPPGSSPPAACRRPGRTATNVRARRAEHGVSGLMRVTGARGPLSRRRGRTARPAPCAARSRRRARTTSCRRSRGPGASTPAASGPSGPRPATARSSRG